MPASTRYSPATPIGVALLALGALLRAVYVVAHPAELVAGEAFRVTVAFARTGTLANPFLGDTGPTAHLLPIPPLIGGFVYKLLGVGTRPAETLLSCWSIGLVLAAFAMTAAAFRRAGASLTACLLGLGVCCALPLNLGLEAITFRLWEGALAAALAAALLLGIVTLDRAGAPPSPRATAAVGLGAALLFLVSPQLGLAGYAAVALLYLRRVPTRGWPVAAAIGLLAFCAVIGPWVLRNERVFGEPLLRSNAGLELSIGFNPGAVDPADPHQAYIDRLRQVQPLSSWPAFHALQAAGGEVPYARRLGAKTRSWITAHPLAALRLGVRHVGYYLFPPPWMFESGTGGGDHGLLFKWAACWLLTALGLLGLTRRAASGVRSRFTLVAPMVVVPALLFFMVQPILRYRYLIYVPLNFYAADAAMWLAGLVPGAGALLARVERVLDAQRAQPVAAAQ